MASKEQYSADYIELSINENNDNDEPPDSNHHKEEQDCQPTTALLTDQDNSSEEDFITYESERNKTTAPKHENSLAIQVNHLNIYSLLFFCIFLQWISLQQQQLNDSSSVLH